MVRLTESIACSFSSALKESVSFSIDADTLPPRVVIS